MKDVLIAFLIFMGIMIMSFACYVGYRVAYDRQVFGYEQCQRDLIKLAERVDILERSKNAVR